jgi:hypothetical protein
MQVVSSTFSFGGFSPRVASPGGFFLGPLSSAAHDKTPQARRLPQENPHARVYDVAVESALEPAKNLSRRLHNKVLLKREDQQAVFSFKLRGAYNKMAT